MEGLIKHVIHIDDIQAGDCLECEDGFVRTVGKNNIKRNTFMGTTVFGSAHRMGKVTVWRQKSVTLK